jgi:hypothetical protein
MTPVLRSSGVLCYVETRVLTRVEVTGIDGVMRCETVSWPPSSTGYRETAESRAAACRHVFLTGFEREALNRSASRI